MALSDIIAGFMANPPNASMSPDQLGDQAMQNARGLLPSNLAQKFPASTVHIPPVPQMPDLSSLMSSPPPWPVLAPQMPPPASFDELGQHHARDALAARFPNGLPTAPAGSRFADRANRFRSMF